MPVEEDWGRTSIEADKAVPLAAIRASNTEIGESGSLVGSVGSRPGTDPDALRGLLPARVCTQVPPRLEVGSLTADGVGTSVVALMLGDHQRGYEFGSDLAA